MQYGGVGVELRQALEPWTSWARREPSGERYVSWTDSVERLEVKAKGLVAGRHKILVNGRAVPLKPVSLDEHVGGVRFRAWQPVSALHPTIPSHAPLICEVWDGLAQTVPLGGCTYHVAPSGRAQLRDLSRDGYEAEGRRLARFEPFGFTGGIFEPPAGRRQIPTFPHTLDLRRAASRR